MYKLAKILAVSLHLALQHVTEVFPDMYNSQIFPHKFPRTDIKLTLLHKYMSSKVKRQISDKFAIKLLYDLKKYFSAESISSVTLKVALTQIN